jgi:rare lipoprotein A|nr:septal ring lytic transglycosylase RlpA family protein [Melioribacteraceae bacterium]
MYELTAAHRTYPFNTMIRVVNLKNNKTIIIRINDRGPFVEGRIIDLSLGAAIQLGMDKTGIQEVRLEIIEWGIE